MNFQLTEQQEMLRAVAREFANGEIAPIASEIDTSEVIPDSLRKKLRDANFFGLLIPEQYGGADVGAVEYVLVMEELAGEPLSAFRARAKTDPESARRVADLAFKEILKQVFEDGRFHADPHAGNLLILPDGRLGLIDLGLTGESGEQDRQRIARAVRAFVAGDPEALSRALLDFGTPPPDFGYEEFKADVAAVVHQNESQVVAEMTGRNGGGTSGLETLVNELFKVAHRHNLYVPPSSTLLIKTIVTIEGVARSLNPDLNVLAAAVPIVLRAMSRKWFRWKFWRDLAMAGG